MLGARPHALLLRVEALAACALEEHMQAHSPSCCDNHPSALQKLHMAPAPMQYWHQTAQGSTAYRARHLSCCEMTAHTRSLLAKPGMLTLSAALAMAQMRCSCGCRGSA